MSGLDQSAFPDRLRRRAAAVARGDAAWTPPPLRAAATVCVVRDAAGPLEVFLLRRRPTMAFAAGMHVYPGGAVEHHDADVPLAGRADLARVAAAMTTDAPAALLAAAARETFEECGVLLAVDPAGRAAVPDDRLEGERVALLAGELSFADLLVERGLAVDDAAIVPFAHWVTPEVEDRRFDTRFFLAALPTGQEARDVGGEADRVAWWTPVAALAAAAEGRLPMLPPTVATLSTLVGATDVAAALAVAAAQRPRPLMPRPVVADDGSVEWVLVDDRTDEVLRAVSEPSASEHDGTTPR